MAFLPVQFKEFLRAQFTTANGVYDPPSPTSPQYLQTEDAFYAGASTVFLLYRNDDDFALLGVSRELKVFGDQIVERYRRAGLL